MPLLDPFHPPLRNELRWESFHAVSGRLGRAKQGHSADP
jgi:hypothetical protein